MVTIYTACYSGDIIQVEDFINRCCNQNEIDKLLTTNNIEGFNCFDIAYTRKDYIMLEFLRTKYNLTLYPPFNFNNVTTYDEADDVIEYLIDMQDDVALDEVTNKIENGYSVNSVNYNLTTLLHSACGGCQLNTVKYLLEKGADPNAIDSDFCQPFHYLCDNTTLNTEVFTQIANMLIDKGAMLSLKNRDGKTPFECLSDAECKDIMFNFVLQQHNKALDKRVQLYTQQIKDLQTITPNMQQLFVYIALEAKKQS
jgi:ankyrin repeat protein